MNSPSAILDSIQQLKTKMKHGKIQLEHMKKGFSSVSTISTNKNTANNLVSIDQIAELTPSKEVDRPQFLSKSSHSQLNQKENVSPLRERSDNILNLRNQYKSNPNADRCTKAKILAMKKLHQRQLILLQKTHESQIDQLKQRFETQKLLLKGQLQSKIEQQANYISLLEDQLSPVKNESQQSMRKQKDVTFRYNQLVNCLLQENAVLIEQLESMKKVIALGNLSYQKFSSSSSQVKSNRLQNNSQARLQSNNPLRNRLKFSKVHNCSSSSQQSSGINCIQQWQREDEQAHQLRLTYSIDQANNNSPRQCHNRQKHFRIQDLTDQSQWIGSSIPDNNENIDTSNCRKLEQDNSWQPEKALMTKQWNTKPFYFENDLPSWIEEESIGQQDPKLKTIRNFIPGTERGI